MTNLIALCNRFTPMRKSRCVAQRTVRVLLPVRWRRRLGTLLFVSSVAAASLLSVLLILAAFFAEKLMFNPQDPQPLVAHTPLRLEVAPGVFIDALYLENPKSRYTLLYNHGNTAQLSDLEDTIELYAQHGFSVIAYDYEGYGQSDGEPGEKQLFRDADRIYRYLTGERKVQPDRIIFYGRSIGSGPACYLASRYSGAGLVLEAPFTSAFAVVGMDWLPFDRFRNLDRIRGVNMPLLILHGSDDKLISQKLGRQLFANARQPREFVSVEGAGHKNIYRCMGENYYGKIAAFAAKLPTPPSVRRDMELEKVAEARKMNWKPLPAAAPDWSRCSRVINCLIDRKADRLAR